MEGGPGAQTIWLWRLQHKQLNPFAPSQAHGRRSVFFNLPQMVRENGAFVRKCKVEVARAEEEEDTDDGDEEEAAEAEAGGEEAAGGNAPKLVEPVLYADDTLEQRYALRHHIGVSLVLAGWWQLTQTLDGEDGVDETEYAQVMKKVYRALMEKYDEEDARKTVAEDWKSDSDGHGILWRAPYYHSIFELADVWTETIHASEYIAFLTNLLDCISYWDSDGVRQLRGDGDIRSGCAQPGHEGPGPLPRHLGAAADANGKEAAGVGKRAKDGSTDGSKASQAASKKTSPARRGGGATDVGAVNPSIGALPGGGGRGGAAGVATVTLGGGVRCVGTDLAAVSVYDFNASIPDLSQGDSCFPRLAGRRTSISDVPSEPYQSRTSSVVQGATADLAAGRRTSMGDVPSEPYQSRTSSVVQGATADLEAARRLANLDLSMKQTPPQLTALPDQTWLAQKAVPLLGLGPRQRLTRDLLPEDHRQAAVQVPHSPSERGPYDYRQAAVQVLHSPSERGPYLQGPTFCSGTGLFLSASAESLPMATAQGYDYRLHVSESAPVLPSHTRRSLAAAPAWGAREQPRRHVGGADLREPPRSRREAHQAAVTLENVWVRRAVQQARLHVPGGAPGGRGEDRGARLEEPLATTEYSLLPISSVSEPGEQFYSNRVLRLKGVLVPTRTSGTALSPGQAFLKERADGVFADAAPEPSPVYHELAARGLIPLVTAPLLSPDRTGPLPVRWATLGGGFAPSGGVSPPRRGMQISTTYSYR